MKIKSLITTILILVPFCLSHADDLSQWTNHLIPLPKEITITGETSIASDSIMLVLPETKDILIQAAVKELGISSANKSPFTIQLCLTSEKKVSKKVKKSLAKVANSEQAYAIQPIEKDGEFIGLQFIANSPIGLLYAVRTFVQLVPVNETFWEIPQVTVLDWPDLSERGEWGWNLPHDKFGLAALKMNEVEMHSRLGFFEDGQPRARFDEDMLREAHQIGIQIVPVISHMEQLAKTGLFKYYPELAAVPEPGKPLPTDYQPALCFSHPNAVPVIAAWMRQLLSYDRVNDINVWLAELDAPCYCDRCKGGEPFEMQTRGIVKAFREVKKEFPNAHMRLLLTQASYKVNDKILSAIDPDTRITYYHGHKTYDSSRDPMIYPLLEDFSRSGGWLGVYPQLTNSWRTVFPFTGPQFIQARMQEFVDKKLQSFSGYATPANWYYDFNIAASAEWSWNSHGRSVHEFAAAYATLIGLENPQAFADWAELIGDIGWNLAESRVVESFIFNAGNAVFIDGVITDGTLYSKENPITFGKGILRSYPDMNALDNDVLRAQKALTMAEQAAEPLMIDESMCVLGTLNYVKSYKICADLLNTPDVEKSQFNNALNRLDKDAMYLTVVMNQWGARQYPAERNFVHYRLRDSIDFAANNSEMIRQAALKILPDDPYEEYRFQQVSEWTTSDFDTTDKAVFWMDITDYLGRCGEYDVRFMFEEGTSGVYTNSVTLLMGPSKESANPIDLDKWEAKLSRYGRYIEYWITVPEMPKKLSTIKDRYFIKAEITGPKMELPAERRQTNGKIFIRKSWRDAVL